MRKPHLDSLNKEQRKAAGHIEGPLLIIAGAGSGKTRVVTTRISCMLSQGITQKQILALTFTNKAAREMSERVTEMTGAKQKHLTISTFHAFGVQILRQYGNYLGYNRNFTIYDRVDKISLLKEVLRETGISSDNVDFFNLTEYISAKKMKRSTSIEPSVENDKLLKEYAEHLKLYNAFDFDDLICLPIHLFNEYPEVLAECRDRYKYIMVDEFQDTSASQYEIVRQLALESRNLCVVGDDDQSIYSWRGANYENLLLFEKNFPERIEVKLEQNYRSSSDILAAANSLIAHNSKRKDKSLWTGNKETRSIVHVIPEDEHQEGAFITRTIRTQTMKLGIPYSEFGILVRTNGLMDILEEALLADNIPYRVSGGTSFFQRKEIRDLICYLKVFANPDDDVSLLRILNTPRRGIGKSSLIRLREYASNHKLSLYSTLAAFSEAGDDSLAGRSRDSISTFVTLINDFKERMHKGKGMSKTLADMVGAINYWGFLLTEHKDRDSLAKYKFGNIQRFIDLMDSWERDPDNLDPTLYNYLNRIALVTRDDLTDDGDKGKVNLMTIHAAKGLEFTVVFVAGVEEKFIPHARALEDDPANIEEERRLFYVALTRAKEKLYLSSCLRRKVMREVVDSLPSAFLEEIPSELIRAHEDDLPVASEDAGDFFALMKARLGST
ncbi:MAG: UvrD-helicase domain-containing protein [Spirochaetales bacterium]|jgi:DNA helicase II / ATP-dependent DNA helicase PcrA|nr:UvrD-helicase domain-containing protein [Spirochaetales bacterium]